MKKKSLQIALGAILWRSTLHLKSTLHQEFCYVLWSFHLASESNLMRRMLVLHSTVSNSLGFTTVPQTDQNFSAFNSFLKTSQKV